MSTTNPALIRLVASRYAEMRGLRTIGDAAWLLLCAVCFQIAIWSDTRAVSGALLTGAFAAMPLYLWLWVGFSRKRVERYYDHRFGRIAPRTLVPISWVIVPATGLGWAMIFVDVRAPAAFPIAVVLLTAAAWPAWIGKRDFPYRAHWFLVAIMAIVVALQLPALPAARYLWRMHAMFELGIAMAIAGLCDHLILVRTLGGSSREDVAATGKTTP